ncbi:MAG: AAA family ATPase [SAR324 cluster bacterium]|nr:AAA family ATPase [SAR324 cluster bacterium]
MDTLIKRIREQQGLSISKSSKMSQMSYAQWERIETGDVSPTLKSLHKIAKTLSVPVKALLPDTHQRETWIFFALKGGVGKTTLSLICAKILSDMGYDVVYLDNDFSQASATLWFINQIQDRDEGQKIYEQLLEHNIFSLMTGKSTLAQSLLSFSKTPIRLIGSVAEEEDPKKKFQGEPGSDRIQMIRLEPLKCDYLIVDTPGEFTDISNWSLALADKAIIPVDLEMFSLGTLSLVFSKIQKAQQFLNPNLNSIFILPNKMKSQRDNCHFALETLKKNYEEFMVLDDKGHPVTVNDHADISNFSAGTGTLYPSSKNYQLLSNFIQRLI